MTAEIPTTVLRTARSNAGLNQSALALKLGITPSVVSRMEKAEFTDRAMAWRYLAAVGSPECEQIREFYERPWSVSDRPSFLHPDRDTLWTIESVLLQLAEFENSEGFDPILARPVGTLRSRLLATAQFLLRTDHSIAWLGEIGIGKTTALSHAAGLTLPSDSGADSIFPTGSGRMTVCEVVVKEAPTFGLAVDCLSVDEVRGLVTDMVRALVKREAGIPTELDRVLRAMAGLHRESVIEDGKKRFIDPLKVMVDEGDSDEEIINRVMARLNLEARTRNSIIISEVKEHGLKWLADNVKKINFGQHPDFGVPTRISVLLPSKVLSRSPYDISILDTKGIEGTTQRPDLRAQIDNPRALTILCTRFNDAPGEKPMALLREIVETRSDASERGRVAILVLPWGDEALGVHGDDGFTPETVEDGYLIREEQALGALIREGLPEVPIFFYNARQESAQSIWRDLNGRLEAMRGRYHERARQLASSAQALINDADSAASLEARAQIATRIDRVVARHSKLPTQARPAHQNLIEQAQLGHASSIAASIARRGVWMNFSVYHLLGVGVRADAAARTKNRFVAIDEALADLEDEFSQLEDVSQSIASLRDDIIGWEQEFLGQALALGRVAFKPHLDEANELWRQCYKRWGQGQGYRDDIADLLRNWFETFDELDEARRSIDSGLSQAWQELVLDRLVISTHVDDDDDHSDVAA